MAFFAAIALAACSDAPTSTNGVAIAGAPVVDRGTGGSGSAGGGSGGSGGGGTKVVSNQLAITTPPTVTLTGTYVGDIQGVVPAGMAQTVTFVLTQATTGLISGTATNLSGAGVIESVLGTVNGDTLRLFIGNPCGSCSLASVYQGIATPDGVTLTGTILGFNLPLVQARQ